MDIDPVLLSTQLTIVKHCARECEYQRSGEFSVYNMFGAWVWAQRQVAMRPPNPPSIEDCIHLGKLIEPVKNIGGLRKVGVRVGYDVKMPPDQVPDALAKLFNEGVALLPAAQFFVEFEEIHPFVDGNGRTGNILYNWLMGTLDDPLMPPDHWHQGRVVGKDWRA